MSQENVELVRATIGAFNRNDLDAAVKAMHPEVEWQTLDVMPDRGTYRGRAGVRRFWQMWVDSFQGLQLHLEACDPLGEDKVISTLRISGEGTGSGAGVESPAFFQVLEVRDGQIVWARMFEEKAEALEVVGLEE